MAEWKSKIRTACLKLLHPGLETDGNNMVRLDTEIIIANGGSIKIGKNTRTVRRVTLSAPGGELIIGEHVSFNRNDIVVCRDKVVIGDRTAFGPNITIYDHDHIFGHKGIEENDFNKAPIIIENDCWIAANVSILRGTHIGEGSVIGAGAIVKGDIPPHSLVKSNRELIIEPIRR